ncbi:exosome non-catalytic core subunit rrp4, partial [Lunasporangiospora selenospora]
MASLQVSFHAPLAKDIAHTSQKSRAVKGRKQNELDMDVDDHAMDIDSMIEGAAKSAEKKNTGSAHVVTPGEVITSDSAFMRGHGTYVEQEKVLSSVAGVVERVNKLISVKPLNTRYTGEIGDVVVGRITEVSQKRWKVDVNGRQDAILMLSSINLPGGVQRRKQEADELQMRNFFREGDLLVAEVQAFFGDGAYSLHTRSLKYGKLRNGSFVSVPPSLVQRCKSHFHSLSCGVDLILGLNGYIWVSAHVSQNLDEIDTEHGDYHCRGPRDDRKGGQQHPGIGCRLFSRVHLFESTHFQIAAQFTCEINYDHRATNMNFTILGADPTTQKKAVIALASLFTKATGAVSDPNIPMKAFEDVKADSGNSGAMSMGGIDRSQLLIDLDDINATMESIALAASITTAAEPPTPERVFTEIFVVSDKIHDPHSMLYADKKQAEDLPTMIAKERKCTAIVPDDGRLQQMQDYFLRPAFQSELIPLVYGSFRCEYKLKFISATRHRFTTHNIPYFPSNMPELRIRTDLLKVLKTTYDEDRRAWMPNPDEIIAMEELAAQSSRTQSSPRRNPQLYKANSSSTPSLRSWGPSNSQSDWIEPQRSDWGREEPSYGYRTNSRAGSDYEFAMDPRAAEQTRFSQNSNSRGNFSSSSREPSYSGGGRSWTSHQNPNEHSSNSTSTWTSRIQQNQSSNSRP